MKQFILALALYYALPFTITAQHNSATGTGLFSNESAGSISDIKPGNYLAIHPNDSSEKHDYAYYMHKRKRNKTTGWILLGSGFALIGVAALVSETDNNYTYNSGPAVATCLVASAAAGLASIPFMIIASSNKYKARALISAQETSRVTACPNNYVTGITLAWRLGK